MKKIIGILGILVIAIALFVNVNSMNNSSSDVSLASLIATNVANAEGSNPSCCNDPGDTCKVYGTTINGCDEAIFCNDCNT